MRKNEMTPKQLQDREVIVSTLTQAGWKGTASNRLFEQGKPARAEARMVYQNRSVKLTATYFASKEMVYFGIYEPSGRGVSIASCFNGNLPPMLEKMTTFQDSISSENYKDYIRKIMRMMPESYVERDGQLIPLVNDGADNA